VIVRTAIQDHGYRWTWILVGLLVLYGASALLNNWRRAAVKTPAAEFREDAGEKGHTKAPTTPSVIGFRPGMLIPMGALGVALSAVSVWGALLVFRDLPQSYWLGVLLGAFMVVGFLLFSWWVVFAVRGLLGRPALILDADGLTDQSSPIPLGRVAWADIEAIHWQWPGTPLATRPYIAVDCRNAHGWQSERTSVRQLVRKTLRSHGLDPAKLAVSDEELAHEFRRYSGGRFGIRQR
jgi:hypothetical protein